MNFNKLKEEYPQLKTIVAVSKTQPVEKIHALIRESYLDFGENKVQELLSKAQTGLPVVWHYIGHLQTNKVKECVRVATWIHAVDSIKLLEEIDDACGKLNKNVNVLMQVNLTNENTKFGMLPGDVDAFLEASKKCKHAKLKGLMIIGPTTTNNEWIDQVFTRAEELKTAIQKNIPEFTECSMGMSQDYKIALKHGATMIRIGTLIFGERSIKK